MNLWEKYKDVLHKTFPLHNAAGSVWATWEGKGTHLTAKTYTAPYIIKSREVEIWSEKNNHWLENIDSGMDDHEE